MEVELTSFGLASSDALVPRLAKSDEVVFVWILSRTVSPQPPLIRGVWTSDGVWESDSVWYS